MDKITRNELETIVEALESLNENHEYIHQAYALIQGYETMDSVELIDFMESMEIAIENLEQES